MSLELDADGEPPIPASRNPDAAAAGGKGSAASTKSAAVAPPAAAPGTEALAKDIEVVIDACNKVRLGSQQSAFPTRPLSSPTKEPNFITYHAYENFLAFVPHKFSTASSQPQDIEALARAYYAVLFPPGGAAKNPVTPPTKGGDKKPSTAASDGPLPIRPICYLARIPDSVDSMLDQTGKVLEGLREQLRAHLVSGVKELRTQVSALVQENDASATQFILFMW